jgi:hypothetical protein
VRWPRALYDVGKIVAVVLIVEYLVLPQLAGSKKSLRLLLNIDNIWLLSAVVLEAGSLLTYGLLSWGVSHRRSN